MTEFDQKFGMELEAALPLMRQTARLYIERPDDLDDVVQDAALLAWRHRGQARNLSAWLHSIVRNAAHTMVRRRHALRRPEEIQMDALDAVDCRILSAETMVIREEQCAAVHKQILELPARRQASIIIYLNSARDFPVSRLDRVRYLRAVCVLRTKFRKMAGLHKLSRDTSGLTQRRPQASVKPGAEE